METVATNPLQPVFDLLKKTFPDPPQPTEDEKRAWAEADRRDAARQDYVARRTPELVRQYRMDDEKLRASARHAAQQFSVGMGLAFRHDDDAELGRLFRARMCAYLQEQATDAAEEGACRMFPEVP